MNESDYLVVCPSLKRAAMCHERLYNYLAMQLIPCRAIKSGSMVLIDIMGTHMIIKFTSERKYDECSKGFRGSVVSEAQVDEWLDAAEVSDE